MSHPPRAAAAMSPDARKAPPPPPVMYCSACGDSCVSMEAFQSHVMEKHRPLSPPTTRTPFKASPPATVPESPAKLAPPSNIQPDIGRYILLHSTWFVLFTNLICILKGRQFGCGIETISIPRDGDWPQAWPTLEPWSR
jgi:hypothetical protein